MDQKHHFLEVALEANATQEIYDKALCLPSFKNASTAFPAMPKNSDIICVALKGLPFDYGLDYGLQRLRDDIANNFKDCGKIVDPGITVNTSGFYNGKGFVTLAKQPNTKYRKLYH